MSTPSQLTYVSSTYITVPFAPFAKRKAKRALFIEAPRRNNVAGPAKLQIKRPKEFGSGVISLCAGLQCGKL